MAGQDRFAALVDVAKEFELTRAERHEAFLGRDALTGLEMLTGSTLSPSFRV